jgi:hypothetical protein
MRGAPLPDLEYHGLAKKMQLAAALIAEQDRLRPRASELGAERMALEEEIKKGEHQHTTAWGRAMRAGEDAPTDEAIGKARERLEAVKKEIAAVRHAGDLSTAELQEAVGKHREEWDAEVKAKAEKILAQAQQIAAALTAKLSETEGLVGVHTWLESSGQFYTPGQPTAVSIEHLLHERRRQLGLLDVGVVR